MFKKDANGNITQLTTAEMGNIGGGGSGLYHGPQSKDLTWLWITIGVLVVFLGIMYYIKNKY
jgi:hypothetical protein